MVQKIGILNEKPLHAGLKTYLAGPGDQFEVEIGGYVVDLVKDDLLVEIQTSNFSSIKNKLVNLTQRNRLKLVYPIAGEKWIVKLPEISGGKEKKRKSPKRGRMVDVFNDLVYIPHLITVENFMLEILLTYEEEVRRYIGKGRWRNQGWAVVERRLIGVIDRYEISNPNDLMRLIPSQLPQQFTTLELAETMDIPQRLAQKAAYCLRNIGTIKKVGNRDRRILYEMN